MGLTLVIKRKFLTFIIGKCRHFGLYSIVDRKPADVTISHSLAARWRREGRTIRMGEFWADCSLCMLDVDIPYIMELE